MSYDDMYCEVIYHYENVPNFIQTLAKEEFMRHRSEVVAVFNEHIDKVNAEWELTGEPCSFGKFVEDINPKYADFIQQQIQPYIDVLNKKFPLCKYRIDERAVLVGYLPFVKNSKLWITLEMIES